MNCRSLFIRKIGAIKITKVVEEEKSNEKLQLETGIMFEASLDTFNSGKSLFIENRHEVPSLKFTKSFS